MQSAFDFKQAWKVEDALKTLQRIADRPDRPELRDPLHTVKAYIGILEQEVTSWNRKYTKENGLDELCI